MIQYFHMPRRVQDIVPNTHRSIQDIPVERNSISAPVQPPKDKASRPRIKADDLRPSKQDRSVSRSVRIDKDTDDDNTDTIVDKSVEPKKHHRKQSSRGSKKWVYITMGIVIAVAGAGYVASVYFSRATFSIMPRNIAIPVNSTYIAQASANKTPLSYELVSVRGTATVTASATDGPQISTSAKGKISIYNTYSAQPQRLIAGTRLSDPSGHIYRLAGSVTVPGYTVASPNNKPGVVSATITADMPGQAYNIVRSDAPLDLKIVAYKGTPRYDGLYARLATDIAGGFVGTKKTVLPSIVASSTVDLQAKITNSLLGQIQGTIPDGYIMYPKAYITSFGQPVIGGSDPAAATITMQGMLYGVLLKRSELVSRIAGDANLAEFAGFDYTTPGLESLDFSISNPKDFSPEKKNTLIIKLKGDMSLLGTVPVESLKQKLAGLSLVDTESILRSYKPVIEIEKSSGEVTPPWSKVPSDIGRITIEVLTK